MQLTLNARACFIACLILIAFSNKLLAQNKFETGYFINNENIKTECLIKDVDSKYNPKSFDMRMNNEDKITTISISEAKEFGIPGNSRFVRGLVKIDRSNDDPKDLDYISKTKEPEWSTEQVFLREIVDGPATLYIYQESDLIRFFYSVDTSSIEQLVCKVYRLNETNYTYNKAYISQLRENVNCSQTNSEIIEYKQTDLEKYFTAYNTCKGFLPKAKKTGAKRKHFTFGVVAGMNFSSLSVDNRTLYAYGGSIIATFDSKATFLAGAYAEYILPFSEGKLRIPLELYYRSYNSDGKDNIGTAHISYAAIEFATGARYYVFINNNFNLFLSALVTKDFTIKGDYQWKTGQNGFNPPQYTVPIKTTMPIVAFGIGCSYKRISGEFRYFTYQNLFGNNDLYYSTFKNLSVSLRYRILEF